MCSWVRGPSQAVAERRRESESAPPTDRSTSVAEQVHEQARKASWDSKHISGTGAAAAAFRAQYPRSNSRS